MNIYDIFRRASPDSNISLSKLQEIHRRYCAGVPFQLLCEHRKIYHLQRQLRFLKPAWHKAPESDTGDYIDARGVLRDTQTIKKREWSATSPHTYSAGWTRLQQVRLARGGDYWPIARFLDDRTINITFINEHTIPKWEPRNKNLSMDQPSDLTTNIEELLNSSCLVLRAKPLALTGQYELWTLSRKNLVLKVQIVTIRDQTIGIGKTPAGSLRAMLNRLAKAVTNKLSEAG